MPALRLHYAADIDRVRDKIPPEMVEYVHALLKQLDRAYGADRAPDADGGFVLVVTSLADISDDDLDYAASPPEGGRRAPGGWEDWVVLCNNEFGVNVLLPPGWRDAPAPVELGPLFPESELQPAAP